MFKLCQIFRPILYINEVVTNIRKVNMDHASSTKDNTVGRELNLYSRRRLFESPSGLVSKDCLLDVTAMGEVMVGSYPECIIPNCMAIRHCHP